MRILVYYFALALSALVALTLIGYGIINKNAHATAAGILLASMDVFAL